MYLIMKLPIDHTPLSARTPDLHDVLNPMRRYLLYTEMGTNK